MRRWFLPLIRRDLALAWHGGGVGLPVVFLLLVASLFPFAVGPDGRVQQRRVETGARMGEQVQILLGVDGSAPLVRTGGGFLNDGDTVSVQSAR